MKAQVVLGHLQNASFRHSKDSTKSVAPADSDIFYLLQRRVYLVGWSPMITNQYQWSCLTIADQTGVAFPSQKTKFITVWLYQC